MKPTIVGGEIPRGAFANQRTTLWIVERLWGLDDAGFKGE
jgi:hypothetical protein